MDKLKSAAEKLGIYLNHGQIEQFEIYYRELIEWNKRINLTSITDYEEVQVKHFLDSLTVVTAIDPKDTGKSLTVIDVGTGAGLPGIPLKIILPDIKLALLEATAKKTKFLEHLIIKLGLKEVEIVAERAEEAAHKPQYREKFDIVLSRAVAALPALVELTLPFCTLGGYCIAQKKGDIEGEIEQSKKAIKVMGGHLREIKPVTIKELDDNRCLVIIDKVKSTPAEYPRRPGMPEKRPIIS
jgi:16S rRNA (guanine527-N7)-methyltransferase